MQTTLNDMNCLIEYSADHDSVAGMRGRLVTSRSVIQTYSDNRKLVAYCVIPSPHFDIAMTVLHAASDNGASVCSFEDLPESSVIFIYKKK